MRKILYILLLVIPLALGGLLGYYAGLYLSNFNSRVKLAVEVKAYNESLAAENPVQQETLSIDVQEFLKTPAAEDPTSIYTNAGVIKRKFGTGGVFAGAWLALVFFLKTLNALRGRRYEIREPDPQLCVSCARCFESCPVERKRLKKSPTSALGNKGKNG
ncbi:MAG: hypothetical protein WCI43_01935 [Candidatus Firestonebacteria bacterium]